MIREKMVRRSVDGCFEVVMRSNHRQLAYRIMIALPHDSPPREGYPVIYALDGDAVFDTFAQAARVQTRKPHGYDPVVMIGIGYPSGQLFDMQRRCYDFTMPAPAENLPLRPNGSPWPENGGADHFLDFIERELKPELSRSFPIDHARQTIFGHSLGGLFVLHALFTRPSGFQYYAAGSPSIWWNGQAILQEKTIFESAYAGKRDTPKLLIMVGEDEREHMVNDAKQLAVGLQYSSSIHAEFAMFECEGHVSVLPAAISRTLKFALSS
ncbi:alpha/beta hydrolase [Marinicrinis lubricantis]|uniref:Alpha/beta hydrolase n=1 Tax=Marinicrinis lubricantis TaxID=2086470 RepID=A0ABW1IUL3_9BACL